MATAKIEVAHVYTALAEVLKNLSVGKNGTLPGNMGGKAYITAVDASAEVKRQFVENNLVFIPNEEVVTNEHIIHKDRINIRIVIKGSYTIVSTVDNSQVTVSGIGDGLASGTAVAANIGSTNALKNALLRTFLITEQSVEDDSKNGPSQPPAAVRKAQERKANPPQGQRNVSSTQQKIVAEFIETGKVEKAQVTAVKDRIAGETSKKGEDLMKAVYEALSKGEVG